MGTEKNVRDGDERKKERKKEQDDWEMKESWR
jgi:hypothetical protein